MTSAPFRFHVPNRAHEEREYIRRNSERSLRRKLFERHPFCHWCGEEVFEFLGLLRHSPLQATIDHVKSRLECDSQDEHRARSNKVLSCYGCNRRRNDEFMGKTSEPNTHPFNRAKEWKGVREMLPENAPAPASKPQDNWPVRPPVPTKNCFELLMEPPSWEPK
jgi:hypothetical protein